MLCICRNPLIPSPNITNRSIQGLYSPGSTFKMIVAIAAGQKPTLTMDPTETIATITSFIVQVTVGDVEHGSIEYKSLFAAGMTLFLFTFILNNISYFVKKKYQEKYD